LIERSAPVRQFDSRGGELVFVITGTKLGEFTFVCGTATEVLALLTNCRLRDARPRVRAPKPDPAVFVVNNRYFLDTGMPLEQLPRREITVLPIAQDDVTFQDAARDAVVLALPRNVKFEEADARRQNEFPNAKAPVVLGGSPGKFLFEFARFSVPKVFRVSRPRPSEFIGQAHDREPLSFTADFRDGVPLSGFDPLSNSIQR
jgi:hypothetical protein